MKMAPIQPLRSRFAALAPANLHDTFDRHSRLVNIIALAVILLVVAGLAGWTAPLERFFIRHTVRRIDRPLAHCPVHFVTAMVSDGQGGAWIAGEDSGIYHYLPGWPSHWQHYDKKNSPGLVSNHIYSLCLDARRNLANLRVSENRRAERIARFRKNVALFPPARNKYEEGVLDRLVEHEAVEAFWRRVTSVVDPLSSTEAEVFKLMASGERATAEYARVPGVAAAPLGEQRRAVKKAKDRLRKRLRHRLRGAVGSLVLGFRPSRSL